MFDRFLTNTIDKQLKKRELIVSPDTGTSHKILKNRVQMRIPEQAACYAVL